MASIGTPMCGANAAMTHFRPGEHSVVGAAGKTPSTRARPPSDEMRRREQVAWLRGPPPPPAWARPATDAVGRTLVKLTLRSARHDDDRA